MICEAEYVPFSEVPPRALPRVLEDIDAAACRDLWASVVLDQWQTVFEPVSTDKPHERRAAAAWFGGADFREACYLAGLDPQAVMARFRVKMAAMQRRGHPWVRHAAAACIGKVERKKQRQREIAALVAAGEVRDRVSLARAYGVAAKTITNDLRELGVSERDLRRAQAGQVA